MLTGRVLFVLVILSHQRRRIVHVNITAGVALVRRAILGTGVQPTIGQARRPPVPP